MKFGNVNTANTLAKAVSLDIKNFRKGVTAPSEVTIGSTPTIAGLHFSATAELVSGYFTLPVQMDRTVNPNLVLFISLSDTEINSDTLDLTLDYTATIENSTGSGIAKTSTQLTAATTVTTASGLAIGDMYSISFPLDVSDATNPLTLANAIAFEFHLTNITGVAEFDLVGGCFLYEATY